MSYPTQGGLIDLIRDPIGISLQASNSHDSRGFRDLDKHNPASLFNAKTLDVWTRGSGYICAHNACRVSPQAPRDLSNPFIARPEDGGSLMARLLVTRPVVDALGRTAQHEILRSKQRQLDYLPFTPESMAQLFTEFELPPKWFWFRLHAYSVGNFYRHTNWDRSGQLSQPRSIGLVIHFPFILRPARHFDDVDSFTGSPPSPAGNEYSSSRDDPYIWSIALNFSLRHGTTRGLLDGFTDSSFDDLYRRVLRDGSHWIKHPLHIPLILLHIHIDHAAWDMDDVAGHVSDFEQTVLDEERHALKIFNRITTRLAHLGRALKFQSELTIFLLDTLKYTDEIFQTQRPPSEHGLQEISQQMREKLTNFQQLTENYLESCRFLQIKTKDALDYMNATLNANDNLENRRSRKFQDRGLQAQLEDAESNRAISVVTLFFLPPTAVAAISSLSAFQWTKPGGGQYEAPFWLFWLISISLILVVGAIYYIFRSRNRRKELARRTWAELNGSSSDVDKAPDQCVDNSARSRGRKKRRRSSRARSRHELSRNGRPMMRERFGVSHMV